MQNFPLPRIDLNSELHKLLLPYCRLSKGEIWSDPLMRHKVGCFNAEDTQAVTSFLKSKKATLAIQDPPYNFVAFQERNVDEFIEWSKLWIANTENILDENSSLYIWLGADQNNHFQPLPEFMMMMSKSSFKSKSFITMRNQRGYGTQKNWMAIRQELLYYTRGNPAFNVNAEYTDIPKVLRGYYKTINGKNTENFERSKSENIRAGNVWVDVQQVFYRMEENVNGCYAQKPLKSIARIIEASSKENDIVVDFFAHSGTTLLACEQTGRKCYTIDADPVFCEIGIRRLEHFRKTGKTGWQNGNPFEPEINRDKKLTKFLDSVGK